MPPGKNGRIVFERRRLQNGLHWGELFVMDARVERLQAHPSGERHEDINADWSPDGSYVGFSAPPRLGRIRACVATE